MATPRLIRFFVCWIPVRKSRAFFPTLLFRLVLVLLLPPWQMQCPRVCCLLLLVVDDESHCWEKE